MFGYLLVFSLISFVLMDANEDTWIDGFECEWRLRRRVRTIFSEWKKNRDTKERWHAYSVGDLNVSTSWVGHPTTFPISIYFFQNNFACHSMCSVFFIAVNFFFWINLRLMKAKWPTFNQMKKKPWFVANDDLFLSRRLLQMAINEQSKLCILFAICSIIITEFICNDAAKITMDVFGCLRCETERNLENWLGIPTTRLRIVVGDGGVDCDIVTNRWETFQHNDMPLFAEHLPTFRDNFQLRTCPCVCISLSALALDWSIRKREMWLRNSTAFTFLPQFDLVDGRPLQIDKIFTQNMRVMFANNNRTEFRVDRKFIWNLWALQTVIASHAMNGEKEIDGFRCARYLPFLSRLKLLANLPIIATYSRKWYCIEWTGKKECKHASPISELSIHAICSTKKGQPLAYA